MADFIFEANELNQIGKAINKLNNLANSYELRRFVLKDIVTKYYDKHGDESQPIISVKDYTDYLFPDTESWKETRDVLVIALYQKLHEKNIKIEFDINESEQ